MKVRYLAVAVGVFMLVLGFFFALNAWLSPSPCEHRLKYWGFAAFDIPYAFVLFSLAIRAKRLEKEIELLEKKTHG